MKFRIFLAKLSEKYRENVKSHFTRTLTPFKISVIYVIMGVFWILFSDRVAEVLFPDTNLLSLVHTIKGIAYVFVTGILLFSLIYISFQALKETEEVSRFREERFRNVFTESPIGIEIFNSDGRLIDINKACLDMFGASDLRGFQRFRLFEDPNFPEEQKNRLSNGEMIRFELVFDFEKVKKYNLYETTKSGIRYLDVQLTPIDLKKKTIILGQIMDITEHRLAEITLEKTQRALKTLSKFNQAIIYTTNEIDLIHKVCQIILESGYRLAWVGFANQDREKSVVPVAYAGFEEGYLESVNITWDDTERGKGPTGKAIRTGKPSIARNILTDDNFAPWRDAAIQRGYASSIALPLIFEGKTFGALNIYASEPEAFDTEEVMLLVEAANDLAFGIMTLRSLVEKRRLEKKYKMLVEKLEEGVLIEDTNGFISFVNPKLTEILGYTKDELLGKHWSYLIPDEDLEKIKAQSAKRKKGISSSYEVSIQAKDGQYIPSIVSATPILSENREFEGTLCVLIDITERKKAEIALQESEKHYRSLFDDSPISLWEEDFSEVKNYIESLRRSGVKDFKAYFEKRPEEVVKCVRMVKILDVNKATLELYKANNKEQLLANLEKLFTEKEYNIFREQLVALSEAKKRFKAETINQTLEGDEIYIIIRISVVPGYEKTLSRVLVAIEDITERKKIEIKLAKAKNSLEDRVIKRTKELFNEKKRIEGIIETLPDGILVVDVDKNFYLSNKAFKDYYKRIYNIEFPRSLQDILILGNPFGDTISRLVYVNQNKSTTVEPIEGLHLELISSQMTTPPDIPLGVIIVVRDVSSYVELNRLRHQFVSTVSHELRTPITAINLAINTLSKYTKRLTEKQKEELLKAILQSSLVMNQMVTDLLILSRVESKTFTLNKKICLVKDILTEVIFQLETQRQAKKLTVQTDIDPNIELYGDNKRLSQIFRILLDNAIKYSPEDSNIKIKAIDHYQGKYNPENVDGVLVQVSDSGIGIKSKDLPHIFKRFFRANDVTKTQGTGLGLSIAKELVELHKGKIFVESEYGKGSTFTIFLPQLEKKPSC
ncbi:MAG: PAS domain S-box protein [Candidatus Hodarchaeales archaeon]